jgi:RimJ/RimL family protein N-acetyltransferase
MVIETERLVLREMVQSDFFALYKVLADSNIMQHYPYTLVKTAISYGCKQVDEFHDDVNEITKVFAITREEWSD